MNEAAPMNADAGQRFISVSITMASLVMLTASGCIAGPMTLTPKLLKCL